MGKFQFCGILSLALTLSSAIEASEHPFLITKTSDYSSLQNLAATAPFSQMKASAVSRCKAAPLTSPVTNYPWIGAQLRDVFTTCSLAYILDSSSRSTSRAQILSGIQKFNSLMNEAPGKNYDWNFMVSVGSALFDGIIALDILYPDLTTAQIQSAEKSLGNLADWYGTAKSYWQENLYAVRGIWALYKGDTARADQAIAAYQSWTKDSLTDDGIFRGGAGYAWARYTSFRHSKVHFKDVLEFNRNSGRFSTPISFYDDPKIQNFYEWMLSTISPFRKPLTFGDSSPEATPDVIYGKEAPIFTMARYSKEAAETAAWVMKGKQAEGQLYTYLLVSRLPEVAVAAKKPQSKIYKSGFANLWENNPADTSLQGVLHSPTQVEENSEGTHGHKEANSIVLNGYGEMLLRNVGYNGAGQGCGDSRFNYSYVNNTAVSSNTVLVNDQDHSKKSGGGLIDGWVGGEPKFEFATSVSGNAIASAKHERSLFFAHPDENGRSFGYWFVLDVIKQGPANGKFSLAFHPNSTSVSTLTSAVKYRSTVQELGSQPVQLTTFFASEPQSVAVRDGALCSFNNKSKVGKFLYANHALDSNGQGQALSVFFPSDATHPEANIASISGNNFTGARIEHSSAVQDEILSSLDQSQLVTYGNLKFAGRLALVRHEEGAANAELLLQQITSATTPSGLRLSSVQPFSIWIRGNKARISSGSALSVHFQAKGLQSVMVSSASSSASARAAVGNATDGFDIALPAGSSDLEMNVVLDTEGPSLSVASPINGQSILGSIRLSATASDPSGVSKVEFHVDSKVVQSLTAAPYESLWDSKSVTDGSHQMLVKAYDTEGNMTTSAVITFTVKNIPPPLPIDKVPTVKIIKPASNASVKKSTTVTIEAQATDDIKVVSVEFRVNNTLLCTEKLVPYTCSWKVPSTAGKTYKIEAKVKDSKGQTALSTISVKSK